MNQPPADAIRVPHERMRTFVYDAARKADIPDDHATLLSELLVACDLRGVFSHGSRQIVRYVREIRRGGINPRPRVTVARETPTSLLIDGDWGLGYFALHDATARAIEKAKQHGMAAAVTRHHGHIGAAGIYARMTLAHDLIAFVTSGVQLDLRPGDPIERAAGGSPMAFSAPAGREPPLVLDCGVTHDIQHGAPHRDELARIVPGIVLRAIGFGAVCQAWGGLLAGVPIDPARADRPYAYATQGAMIVALRIDLFADIDQFKREIDEYVRRVRQLAPLEGTGGAHLPGGIEAEREQAWRRDGIPVGDAHRRDLEKLADELELAVPWR